MVPKWKRVLMSILSLILGMALVCLFLTMRVGAPDPKEFLQVFGYFIIMMFYFGSPGWFLALPAILLLTNLRTWRFWAALALGAALGPIYTSLRLMLSSHTHQLLDVDALALTTPVSTFSTLIYLLLLRRSQGRRTARTPRVSTADRSIPDAPAR